MYIYILRSIYNLRQMYKLNSLYNQNKREGVCNFDVNLDLVMHSKRKFCKKKEMIH